MKVIKKKKKKKLLYINFYNIFYLNKMIELCIHEIIIEKFQP